MCQCQLRALGYRHFFVLSGGCQVLVPLPNHFRRVDPPLPMHIHRHCRDLSRFGHMHFWVCICMGRGGRPSGSGWEVGRVPDNHLTKQKKQNPRNSQGWLLPPPPLIGGCQPSLDYQTTKTSNNMSTFESPVPTAAREPIAPERPSIRAILLPTGADANARSERQARFELDLETVSGPPTPPTTIKFRLPASIVVD